jgi:hypothetical protein
MTAIDAYAAEHARALAAVHELSQLIEDSTAPSESTDWGDVGDLVRINELLKQSIDFLKGTSC